VDAVVGGLRAFAISLGLPAQAPVRLDAAAQQAVVAAVRRETLYLGTNPRPVSDAEILDIVRATFGA